MDIAVDGQPVTITQAVYFQEGTTRVYLHPEKPGEYLWSQALEQTFGAPELQEAAMAADPPLLMDVPEWHYQLLTADGRVVGHGDHYTSEEHVVAAIASAVGDGVGAQAGDRQAIDHADAMLGKASATGSPHCTSCGEKLTVAYESTRGRKHRAARDAEVYARAAEGEGCPHCGGELPDGEVA